MHRSELILAAIVTVIASGSASLIAVHVARSDRRIDTIETRSVTIVDETNRPVAVLSSTHGAPELALFDQRRQRRVSLFLEENGTPDLYLNDAAGKTRAALDLYDSGVPNLEFLGTSGGANGPSILLESTNDGEVRLAFHDFQNRRVLGMVEFRTGPAGPKLELVDSSGKPIWSTEMASMRK
ncbi:MAG TPA: hypothetical protein VKB56_00290 [Terriglobales bacterium]|nr:hypothetical protein [Terriglobales bacterium]